MGLILLDTSILIDNLRGHPGARKAIDAAADDGSSFAASALTKIEVLSGMRSGERRATRELLEAMVWVPVLDRIAEEAGALARRYRASHRGIGVVDMVIAATAAHFDAALWTRNVRHFPMIPGLAAPY